MQNFRQCPHAGRQDNEENYIVQKNTNRNCYKKFSEISMIPNFFDTHPKKLSLIPTQKIVISSQKDTTLTVTMQCLSVFSKKLYVGGN